MTGRTIGIDLGTTHSVAGWLDADGQPRLVDVDGRRVCPSVVSYPGPDEVLVGAPALNRMAFDPDHTIRSAKRHMGGDATWSIHGRTLDAPAVQAEVLRRLVRAVAEEVGEAPGRAVVTVPAYFDQVQRQATRRAAELAGLEVVRLLNEPTAAALAHRSEGGTRQVLVYDLGGGTFDASLVRQEGDLVEVLASHGDTALGGDDLDRLLADRLLARWARQHGLDVGVVRERIRADAAASVRLSLAAEAAKRELSSAVETTVRLDYLVEAEGLSAHLEVELTRAELEAAARPLLERSLRSVERVLSDARVDARDLDAVLLVGGMTRAPAVGELLREALGREPDASLHPEECVAVGAVVQAGISSGAAVGRVLVDVSPYSLSLAHLVPEPRPHMRCRTITPRNTPLPSRRAEQFFAMTPTQREVRAFLFQGDDVDPLGNRCIAELKIEGLARREGEEVPTVTCEVRYDLDGVVGVTLANRASGRRDTATLHADGLEAGEDLMDRFLAELERDEIAPGPGRRLGERPTPRLQLLEGAAGGSRRGADAERETRSADAAMAIEGSDAAAVAVAIPPAPPAGLPGALEEDYRVLERVAEHLPKLERAHPQEAAEIRTRLAAARDAFCAEPCDEPAAVAAYDRLSDLLFDLGEFL